ncbi:MAG: hypothetical protein LAO20_06280 [Acidobacteriia bacterium]|nr:hypothetical protein [Terriglobia bacterium]
MIDDISTQLRTLLSGLQVEADRLLVIHEVYDILSYGWSDHDTPDSEHIGHAMWQTSPPFEPEWGAFFSGNKVRYVPTDRDEVLIRNSEDFAGTMIFARRSIGMALCYFALIDSNESMSDNQEFWHEYSTALQWLNIASDRLRDFFLMARFGQNKGQYLRQSSLPRGQRGAYAAPFQESLDTATDDNRQLLNKLLAVTTATQSYRDLRNALVHEVATRTAQQSINVLVEQRRLAAQGPRTYAPEKHVGGDAATKMAAEAYSQISSAVESLELWYKNLVDSSSLVFEFEYFNRRTKNP